MTVRKKTRRGKPRWVIEISYNDTETGVRTVFRQDACVQTKTAAESEDRRKLVELGKTGRILTARQRRAATEKKNEVAKRECIPFKTACEVYEKTKAATRLKRTTRRGYFVSLNVHLLPRWGELPVNEIGFTHFDRLDADLIGAGLKPASRANIMCAGRSVLRHCMDRGELDDLPRLPRLPKGGEAVLRIPDEPTVDALIAAAPRYLRLPLILAADAGKRAGEIRGARWSDVDLVKGTIVVRETVYFGVRDTPKSGHEREIPLTPRLRAELERAAIAPHHPTDPLAPNSRGRVWGESSLAHAMKRLLMKLELEPFKFHSLRHYFVTQLFKAGVGAPTVRDLAGHRHMQVTARYAHSDEAARRAAIAALGRLGS